MKEIESIYFTTRECEHIKSCIAKKLSFIVKKSSNKKEVIFEGEEILPRYRDIWQGKDYFVHVDFNNSNGNYHGSGYATIDFKDFESVESINALIDKNFKDKITDSERMSASQMSLFD
ncbi:MAG: hypothetical protein RSD64_04685 [Christensenellaceae bacterium]